MNIIIQRTCWHCSALQVALLGYFVRKFQEEGRYIVGKWWDRKGFNEIDLVVVDPIRKEASVYELKKDERYVSPVFLFKNYSY